MGLRDIFNGMQNGPRGQRQPSISGSGGGMSRIMMALLGLLAYKSFKGSGGQAAPTDAGNPPKPQRAAAPLALGFDRTNPQRHRQQRAAERERDEKRRSRVVRTRECCR
jgi:hypothetical protein